jgi:hypothetical protein
MTEKGILYFIQQSNDGPIKIGITENLESRLSQLQTSNPYPLIVIHTIELEISKLKKFENFFHSLFEHHRISGEWYSPKPFVKKKIAEVIQNGIESLKEFHWSYEDSIIGGGVWYEIADHWCAIEQVARKYRKECDEFAVNYILAEIKDLEETIRGNR